VAEIWRVATETGGRKFRLWDPGTKPQKEARETLSPQKLMIFC